jgi:hypothetical protein
LRVHAKLEAKLHHAAPDVATAGNNETPNPRRPFLRETFALASWKDRDLFSCSQAGLVNNLSLANCYFAHDSPEFQRNVTMLHCVENR